MNKQSESVSHRPKVDKALFKTASIRIPDDVHRALKARSGVEGRSMSEIIESLVREYLVKVAKRASLFRDNQGSAPAYDEAALLKQLRSREPIKTLATRKPDNGK